MSVESNKIMTTTYQIGQHYVFGCEPRDDIEVAQCGEQQSREEVESHRGCENDEEELRSRYAPTIGRFVLVFVKA